MIDLLLLLAIVGVVSAGVMRLRQNGFEEFVPRAWLQRFEHVPGQGVEGAGVGIDSPTNEPTGDGGLDRSPELPLPPAATPVPGAVEPALQTPPSAPVTLGHPRRFRAAFALGVLSLLLATFLGMELWQLKGDLLPLWGLLACAVAFALAVRFGLPEAEHPGAAGTSPADPEAAASSPHADAPGVGGRILSAYAWRAMSPRARRGAIILGFSVALELMALALFGRGILSNAAWIYHLAAGPLFLYGVWLLTNQRWSPSARYWSRGDTVAVLILMGLGLAARVWNLSEVPNGIWFDEATKGLVAIHINADPAYRPVFIPGIIQAPAAISYVMAPLIQILGRDPAVLRLPSAVAGALHIGAVYLLARILFDRRAALIAAGLLVGMTWQLNFSRIGLNAIVSVFLNALATALFVFGLVRKNAWALAAAGLVAGSAIHFYQPSQLLPIILALLCLHQLATERRNFLRSHGLGLLLFGCTFILAVAPIAAYAFERPGDFVARAGAVNVFKEMQEAGNADPLITSVKAHLLMFNARGDANGRHNWTGRPMLDPLTGALFVGGLALALTRFRRLSSFLPLAWLIVMISGGVFSISWEAPQSHRTVDEVTAVALFSALALSTLGRAAELLGPGRAVWPALLGRLRPRPLSRSRWGLGFSLASAVAVAASSTLGINRYFNEQQQDTRTWLEFSTPQTEAGRLINAVPPGWNIYLDPVLMGYPSTVFMTQDGRPLQSFDPSGRLPLTEESGVAIFLTDREPAVAARIASLYPSARRTVLFPPRGNLASLYSYSIGPEELAASHGVQARYASPDGAQQRQEPQISFLWPNGAPYAPPFAATLEATLSVPTYGTYWLKLEGPSSASLVLDGREILTGGLTTSLTLARGGHALRVEAAEAGLEPLQLLWGPSANDLQVIPRPMLQAPPIQVTGLLARLYRGLSTSGAPDLERIDPAVNLRVHEIPLPRPYTVEWTGALLAPKDGQYEFGTTSISTSQVWVDEKEVVNNAISNSYASGALTLSAGWHDLRVRFVDAANFSRIELFWRQPGGEREIVPSEALRPWPAARIGAAFPADADILSTENRRTRPATLAAGAAIEIAGPPNLARPRGIALGRDGTAYVADAGRQAVIAVSVDGTTRVLGEGVLKEPSAVVVHLDGTLVVLDAGAGAAFRMDASGTLGERLAPGESLYGPRGLALAADGRFAISDTGNNRVLILSPQGAVLNRITGVREPTDAAFLPDGNLLIAETGADRLSVVALDGRRIGDWRMPKSSTVVGPHLAVLPDGSWIASAPESRGFLRLRPGAREPQPWNPDPGAKRPSGVAVGSAGVLVADAETGSLKLLGPPP